MSFNSVIVQDGIGQTYKLDVSLDNFATIYARYSTHGGVDATNVYDPRIVQMGEISRAFGEDFAVRAGNVSLVLSNEDAAVDWLTADQGANYLNARFRLYLGVFTLPLSSAASIQWKQLGEFVCSGSPIQDNTVIRLLLEDDLKGALAQVPTLPTMFDWFNSDVDNPLIRQLQGGSPVTSNDFTPIQLTFGDDWVKTYRGTAEPASSGPYAGYVPFVICATTDTATGPVGPEMDASALASGQTAVKIHLIGGPGPQDHATGGIILPRSVPGSTTPLWFIQRSDSTVTAGGRNWKVMWCGIHADTFALWMSQNMVEIGWGSADDQNTVGAAFQKGKIQQIIGELWVKAPPLSGRTNTNTTSRRQHPVDVIADLCSYYYDARAVPIDSASFDRVRTNYPLANCSGVIAAYGEKNTRQLADHLSDIASSHDLDVFMGWDATVHVAARNFDFASQTATLVEIAESGMGAVTAQVPERETRWAPFNRVIFTDQKVYSGTHPNERRADAVYLSNADFYLQQAAWGRVLPKQKSVRWLPAVFGTGTDPFMTRGADFYIRKMMTFATDMAALQLELADLFRVSWTRNLGGPYAKAPFRLEEIRWLPGSNNVTVKAIWFGDVDSVRSYILDDDDYHIVCSGSGGRTATVTDTASTVTFSSGNLVTDGVQVGDHFVIKDAAEAATSFKRWRTGAIVGVFATSLEVIFSDFDFGAPTGATFSGWEVRHSHLTYPTPASDPTHYADGANPYGRVCNTASPPVYSGNGTGGFTAAHKLREG